jgi:hypothetical protein
MWQQLAWLGLALSFFGTIEIQEVSLGLHNPKLMWPMLRTVLITWFGIFDMPPTFNIIPKHQSSGPTIQASTKATNKCLCASRHLHGPFSYSSEIGFPLPYQEDFRRQQQI